MPQPKRFVSWVAVSSRPQMDGGSPTDQRERNKAHIEKWGGCLVADLEVPGQSRSYIEYEEAKAKIEAYRQLDALIKANAFDVLVCFNVGRLGRKRSLITTVIDLCYEAGILVYRTSSPPTSLEFTRKGYSELLVEAVESATYQNEVDQLVEHNKTGMIRRVERGYIPGNVPIGYRKVFDSTGKASLVIEQHEAEAIRLAIDWYCQGYGISQIATRLNEAGYRNGGRDKASLSHPYGIGSVQPIFTRIWVYAGYAEVNRVSKARKHVRVKSEHVPPIIDESTLQSVLSEMALRKRANPPKGHHLFSGVAICTSCNARMIVQTKGYRKRRKSGKVWTMATVKCPKKCYKQVSFTKLEKALIRWFDSIAGQELPPEQPSIDADAIKQERQALQRQLEAIPEAQERAYSAFVDGDVGKDTYQAQVKRLETRKRELQDKMQTVDLKVAQLAQAETRQAKWNTVREVGRAMLDLAQDDPAKANAWLREYIRIEFGEDRQINILLA